MDTTEKLKLYYDSTQEIYRLGCIYSLLTWDQRVYMPPRGAKARADQMEYLALACHAKSVDPELARAVDELYETMDRLSPDDQVNIRESKRSLDIERKLPEDFISELQQVGAMSYDTWVKARPANDFGAVQPYLEKLFGLSRRACDLLGYQDNPYDALLDLHEQGATTAFVKPLLAGLAEELKRIIPPIAGRFSGLKHLGGHYDRERQYQLCRRVAQDIGFNFESGRLDVTAHPFMTSVGPDDFRITTRYDESDFLSSLYGAIHESGHALYEMGLRAEWAGTPMGSPVSTAVHESQSRLWENPIGRSKEFCIYLTGFLKDYFPDELCARDPEALWMQTNRVEPSLIRVEADEATYAQHIVIRMLLEEQVIKGDLKVADLPGAWDDLYEKYLGVRPPDFKDGIMQDVHWYQGSVGYFPSYALGNLYNAMMMDAARQALPDLPDQIRSGQFGPLLDWLREKVHRQGMRYRGRDLIRNITGQDLSAGPFVEYLRTKFLG